MSDSTDTEEYFYILTVQHETPDGNLTTNTNGTLDIRRGTNRSAVLMQAEQLLRKQAMIDPKVDLLILFFSLDPAIMR